MIGYKSQNDLILQFLRQNPQRGITSKDAMLCCNGCTRLAARISDLKKRGYRFLTKEFEFKNQQGRTCYCTKYFLVNEDEQ